MTTTTRASTPVGAPFDVDRDEAARTFNGQARQAQAPTKGTVMRAGPAAPVNPALLRNLQERSKRRENRVADQITRFAGSMNFVYIHVVWFGLWIGLRVEHYPFGLLTMIVSLEAIFLSTFVMISQNRADEKRQVLADEQWRTVQGEEQQNETLLRLSKEILDRTKKIETASTAARTVSPTARANSRTSPTMSFTERPVLPGRRPSYENERATRVDCGVPGEAPGCSWDAPAA